MMKEGPRYLVEVPRSEGWTTVHPDFHFDATEIFGRVAPLIVEIGAGNGDQIVAAAKSHPESNYLALEVWQPGVAKIVSRAAKAKVRNVRIIEADAAQAFPILFKGESVREIWTFFPDPWPKVRHHKRRLINSDFASEIARTLVEGGKWRISTDSADYAEQIAAVISGSPQLMNPYAGTSTETKTQPDSTETTPDLAEKDLKVLGMTGAGIAPRFEGRILTRFEKRGIDAGRPAKDFVAIKRGAAAKNHLTGPKVLHGQ